MKNYMATERMQRLFKCAGNAGKLYWVKQETINSGDPSLWAEE